MLDHNETTAGVNEHKTERAVIADRRRTILHDRDQKALQAALDAPAEPTAVLHEAMALHRASRGTDGD